MDLADIALQKTAETADVPGGASTPPPVPAAAAAAKPRGRPFQKGRSGNPAGRPRGIPNPATRAALQLLDGEAEALTRKAIDLAFAGDPLALRLCLERIVGARRGRPVELPGAAAMPPVTDARDLATAMAAVMAAVAQGVITPDEALVLAQTVEKHARTLDAAHIARKRHWRGVLFRAWLKLNGGRIPSPWVFYEVDKPHVSPRSADAIAGAGGNDGRQPLS